MTKTMKVKVIKRDKQSTLVEWVDAGIYHRGTIPVSEIADDEVNVETLNMSIPYGVPWAEYMNMDVKPEDIENELHRRGIWTSEDLRSKVNEAIGAIQTVYRTDVSTLLNAAKAFDKHII